MPCQKNKYIDCQMISFLSFVKCLIIWKINLFYYTFVVHFYNYIKIMEMVKTAVITIVCVIIGVMLAKYIEDAMA